MIRYVTIGARDADEAVKFYDAVLETLGVSRTFFEGGWAGYAEKDKADGNQILICAPFDGGAASAGNGAMVGLHASSPAEVDAFHAAAMGNGGKDEGAPGPRPQYGEGYYLAYVRDPTGNKLAACFKAA